MANLYYFQGLFSQDEIETEYPELFNNLREGRLRELHFEKKHSPPNTLDIYSIRGKKTDRRMRLLFTTIEVDGKPCLFYLEKIDKHRYQDSKFLNNPQLIPDYITKQYGDRARLILTASLQGATTSAASSTNSLDNESMPLDILPMEVAEALSAAGSSATPAALGWWFDQAIRKPDENQLEASDFRLPKILRGKAGSGKTMVMVNLMDQAKRQSENGQVFVCITTSHFLLSEWKDKWYELPSSSVPTGARVEFKTLLQWIHEMNPALANRHQVVGLTEFTYWYQGKQKTAEKGPLANANVVYQELRVCSGYSPREYLALGKKKSILARSERMDRQAILKIMDAWKAEVANNPTWIDPSFVTLNSPHSVDLLFVDELPDFSPGLINALLRYCQKDPANPPALIAAGDELQRLYDEKSLFQYVKELFYQMNFKSEATNLFAELPTTYRLFYELENTLKKILELHQILLGKSHNKQAASTISLDKGPSSRPGRIDWYKQVSKEILDEIKQTLQENPNIIILTLPELIEDAKRLFNSSNIMSIYDFKGMERKIVVAWRIFEDPDLIKTSQVLRGLSKGSNQPATSNQKNVITTAYDSYPELSTAVSRLYTLFTRPRQRLIVLNPPCNKDHQLSWLMQQMEGTINKPNEWRPLADDLEVMDSDKSWLEYSIFLIKHENYHLAEEIFREHLRDHDIAEFQALRNQYGYTSPQPSLPNVPSSSSSQARIKPHSNKLESAKTQQNKKITERLNSLFETNYFLLYEAMTAKTNSFNRVNTLLTNPINVLPALSIKHLGKQLHSRTPNDKMSLFYWLCTNSQASQNLLCNLISSNEPIFMAICARVKLLQKTPYGPLDNDCFHLDSFAFSPEKMMLKMIAVIAYEVEISTIKTCRLMLRDIDPLHKLFYIKQIKNKPEKLNDFDKKEVSRLDNATLAEKNIRTLQPNREELLKDWFNLIMIHRSSQQTISHLLSDCLLTQRKQVILDRLEKNLLQEFIQQHESNPPNNRSDLLTQLDKLRDAILPHYPLSLICMIHLTIKPYLLAEQSYLKRLNDCHHLERMIILAELSTNIHLTCSLSSEIDEMKVQEIIALVFFEKAYKKPDSSLRQFQKQTRTTLLLILQEFIKAQAVKIGPELERLIEQLSPHHLQPASSNEQPIEDDNNINAEFLLAELDRITKQIKQALQSLPSTTIEAGFLRIARDKTSDYANSIKAVISWSQAYQNNSQPRATLAANSVANKANTFFQKVDKNRRPNRNEALSSTQSRPFVPRSMSEYFHNVRSPNVNHDFIVNSYISSEFKSIPQSIHYIRDKNFSGSSLSPNMPIWSAIQGEDATNQIISLFWRNPLLVNALIPNCLLQPMKPTQAKTDNSFLQWLCDKNNESRHGLLLHILEKNSCLYLIFIKHLIAAKMKIYFGAAETGNDFIYLNQLKTTQLGMAVLNKLIEGAEISDSCYLSQHLYTIQPVSCLNFLLGLAQTPEKFWPVELEKTLNDKGAYKDRIRYLFEIMTESNQAGRAVWDSFDKNKSFEARMIMLCTELFFKEEKASKRTLKLGQEFLNLPDKSLTAILAWINQSLTETIGDVLNNLSGLLRVIKDEIMDTLAEEETLCASSETAALSI